MRGYAPDKDELLGRLRKVEGQVRGLQRMLEDDVYCIDVLTQLNSAVGGLRAVGIGLLSDHVRSCVRGTLEGGGVKADAMVEELVTAVGRFARK